MTMEQIIDKHLDILLSWNEWCDKPTESTVTDEELNELESRLGYNLPNSYVRFLKYKHFSDFTIGSCWFFHHREGRWVDNFIEKVFLSYLTEEIYMQGKIPFADWSDWGHLCFDVTVECENYEYPIVLWDHERSDEFPKKFENFEQMIFELDRQEEAGVMEA